MKIETLTDWNGILSGCGCGSMPTCPVPALQCCTPEDLCVFTGDDPDVYGYRVKTEISGGKTTVTTKRIATEDDVVEGVEFQAATETTPQIDAVEAVNVGDCLTTSVCSGSTTETFTRTFSEPTDPGYAATDTWTRTRTWANATEDIPAHESSVEEPWTRAAIAKGECYEEWSGSGSSSATMPDSYNPETESWENYSTSATYTVWPDGSMTGENASMYFNVYDIITGGYWWGFDSIVDTTTHSEEDADSIAYTSPVVPECTPSAGGGVCSSLREGTEEEPGRAVNVTYRWRIPATHLGSYFKITWDVLTEPIGFDAMIDDPDYVPPTEEPEGGFPPVPRIPRPGRPSRSLETDLTYTWTGPGNTEDADDPSWFSGNYILAAPTAAGVKRVVNIRYECYRATKFGTRPETTGEGVALP